jgi:putative intracellular protease/amidase
LAKVLMPIPSRDFDPTEVAVSWSVLRGLGHEVAFATPDGMPGAADNIMVTGEGLDFWGFLPGLRKLSLIGRILAANADARTAYAALLADPAFLNPMSWDAADDAGFDGLLLPGGHRARGMRAYLESPVLQALVVGAFVRGAPVGAICHGVLLAARSRGIDGRSVMFGRRTTALTWSLERAGWRIGRVFRFWDPGYYRTYPDGAGEPAGYMSVEAEVTRALAGPEDFLDVPTDDPQRARKTGGLVRDTPTDSSPAFVVRDGAYVSARWPGDAHTFARVFAEVLSEPVARGQAASAS